MIIKEREKESRKIEQREREKESKIREGKREKNKRLTQMYNYTVKDQKYTLKL